MWLYSDIVSKPLHVVPSSKNQEYLQGAAAATSAEPASADPAAGLCARFFWGLYRFSVMGRGNVST